MTMQEKLRALERKAFAAIDTSYERMADTLEDISTTIAALLAAPELLEALHILAAYPIEEFALQNKKSEHPLFGANEWQLQVGHVLAARAAIAKATAVHMREVEGA